MALRQIPTTEYETQDESKIDGNGSKNQFGNAIKRGVLDADEKRRKTRTLAKQQQAAERISASSTQLASGITQAFASVEELKSAMEQIASASKQSAGASHESLGAVNEILTRIKKQVENSERSREKTKALQLLLDKVGDEINALVENVGNASERQSVSVDRMAEMERQAANINESVKAVIRIADQTNLLALNAAIEAARAGKHGKGFAVVADVVRTLAETAEKNAGNIEELISKIQNFARNIAGNVQNSAQAARTEVEKGQLVTEQLKQVRNEMSNIYEGAEYILSGADEMSTAANQALKVSEDIAATSEEQSAACEESLKSLEQQVQAYSGGEKASKELEELADELKNSSDISKSAEEVAASAEELSASMEEVNRASGEIMTAINQISKGAQQQASAVEEAVAGMAQIERRVKGSEERATKAVENGNAMSELVAKNKVNVDEMIRGINEATEAGKKNLDEILELETISRQIDKIVDAIGNVSIQTSMLAVNGAVEAARAGEYGKGFAVVSTDIQNLANDAANNAEQIKDLVKGIQDQIAAVLVDLKEIAESTTREAQKAKSSTSNLEVIEEDMRDVIEGNQNIKVVSSEIATTVNEIKKGMEQIAAGAEQASKAAGESVTAAKQQSQGAEDLAAAIEEIASVADDLQSGS